MSLKFKLDSLDGLDEGLKGLYAKGSDGKFVLQLDDDPAKATMAKLREERDNALKALKDREAKESDAQTAAEKAKAEAAGEYETAKKLHLAENEKLKKQLEAEQARSRNYLIRTEATAAIAAHKGVAELLLPHLTPQLEVIADGDTFKVAGKGGVPISDLLEGFKANPVFGRAFEATASGGGSNPQGGRSAGGSQKTLTRAQFNALPHHARAAEMKAGTTLTD